MVCDGSGLASLWDLRGKRLALAPRRYGNGMFSLGNHRSEAGMYVFKCMQARVGGFQPIPWLVPNPRDWDYLPPGQPVGLQGLQMHISLQRVSLSAFLMRMLKGGVDYYLPRT